MNSAEILGVRIDRITIEDTIDLFEKSIRSNDKTIIANHNLHSTYIYKYDSEFKEFYDLATYTHADGMILIYLAKLLGYDFSFQHRITYIDWLPHILKFAEGNNHRLFYLGGEKEVVKKAHDKISKDYKNLNVEVNHGFFDKKYDSKENISVKEKINQFSPNILMVGMGMPLQEKWILENYRDLKVNVILNSGACFDYVAGKKKTPPRTLSKYGLEWFFRFLDEPTRLFKRYFVEPFFLLPEFLKDLKRISNES